MTARISFTVLAALAALLGAGAMARAADLVVVEARGIDLKPGAIVDGVKPLALKDDQVVTLIAPDGKIIRLRGPSDTPPAPDAGGSTVDVNAALKTLVTQELAGSTELGIVRGTQEQAVPPEPWLIDVTHDGNRCLPEHSPIVFWRPGGGGAVSVSVAPYDRSWIARSEWTPNSDRLVIPTTVPLRPRATYVVRVGEKETAITIIVIPASLKNDAMRGAWMIEAGCEPQVKALVQAAR
jgi:hypothetical protein